MGILTDFFVADAAQALALAVDGPGSEVPAVMAKSVDSVKLATLYRLVTGGHPVIDEVEAPIATDLEDGPWLTVISDRVTVALGQLPDHRIDEVADAWTATDEWRADRAAREDIRVLLRDLRDLARQAEPPARRLYLWTCL
jgi:hypothetical protein